MFEIGCGMTFKDFICGVPNGNGEETFCLNCKLRLKNKWEIEDKIRKIKIRKDKENTLLLNSYTRQKSI